MKPRKNRPAVLLKRFQTTCGWCGKRIPSNAPVLSGGVKARPGVDLSRHAGQALPFYLTHAGKQVLLAVATLDSDARRAGYDFAYMVCSDACADHLKTAMQVEIEAGHPRSDQQP